MRERPAVFRALVNQKSLAHLAESFKDSRKLAEIDKIFIF